MREADQKLDILLQGPYLVFFLIGAHPPTACSMAAPLCESLQSVWSGSVKEMQQRGRCVICHGKGNHTLEVLIEGC